MKRIWLVEDDRPFWPRIRGLLAKVNAVVTVVGPGGAIPADPAGRPDLVAIGDVNQAARSPEWWGGPLLVLGQARASDLVTPIGTGSQQVTASSSIGERALLALTSRLLGVSERRLFRAVIGIRRTGQGHAVMGSSREFSLTGLSFSLGESLVQGERVQISFYVPRVAGRVSLEAEIVRPFVDPKKGSSCYGARFVGLTADEQRVLKRFVWDEA